MRALSIAGLFALAGCTFAQKHPGVTVGVVAGVVGSGACLMAVEKLDTCALIGGIAGVGLGGITGLVTLFADTEDHSLPPFAEEDDDTPIIRTTTEPPPGLPDAGVGAAVDAGVPAIPSDASGGQLDAL
jgi:hypothetical protein